MSALREAIVRAIQAEAAKAEEEDRCLENGSPPSDGGFARGLRRAAEIASTAPVPKSEPHPNTCRHGFYHERDSCQSCGWEYDEAVEAGHDYGCEACYGGECDCEMENAT